MYDRECRKAPGMESSSRTEPLFQAALELDPDEREVFLKEACEGDRALHAEVASLLEAFERSASLDTPAVVAAFPELGIDPDDSWVGREVGSYRLERRIASGGMGSVFEAHQERPRRKVALKLVRGGLASKDALRRLRYEAEVLGRLQHPGIAQIFEAGIHREGAVLVPYFAMELVDRATDIVEHARANGLSTRERVELFRRVLDAVDHGHQKGILHRDLKPANLLVDGEGRPRVIDFGVARATNADVTLTTLHTGSGDFVGTLQYMSPEQCAGKADDLDFRCDVYSLGVVLYELLCGSQPYDIAGTTLTEAARIIREQPPIRPSARLRALRGDLDTVLLKALEKDRDQRYRSAAELSDDLGRWLRLEPLLARPVGAFRRAVRWGRRKPALAAAVLLGIVAFVVSPTVLYVQARSSLTQLQTAREQESAAHEDSDATLEFLLDLFRLNAPNEARGAELTAYELLERGTERLDEFAERPRLQARLAGTLGDVYRSLGDVDAALPLLERGLEIAEREFGPESRITARATSDLAGAYMAAAQYREAEELFRRAIDLEVLLRGEDDIEVAQARCGLGVLLGYLGRLDESIAELEEAERIGSVADQPMFAADVLTNLAESLRQKGETREALAVSERAVETLREYAHSPQPDLASALGLLAKARRDAGELEGADAAFGEAIAMELELYPRGNIRIAFRLYERSFVQEELDRLSAAERSVSQAVEIVETLGETDRSDFADCLARREFLRKKCAEQDARGTGD